MRLLLFILVIMPVCVACAQTPLLCHGKLNEPVLDLSAYTWFYEDRSSDTLPLSVIETKTFRPISRKRNERTSFSNRSVTVTWLKFIIQNTHPKDTLHMYHRAGMHGMITTYENGKVINQAGQIIPGGLGRFSRPRRPHRMESLLSIPPLVTQTYYVRVVDFQVSIIPIISEVLTTTENVEANYDEAVLHFPLLTAMSLLLGCLLFMALYALYSFLLTKDKVFLYYFLYVFCSLLICFHSVDNRFGIRLLFPLYPTLNPYYPGPLHPAVITIFYSLFIFRVTGIRLQSALHIWVARIMLGVLVFQELLSLIDSFRGWPLFENNILYAYGLVPSGVATLLLIGLVLKSNSPLRYYILAGMLSLLCFTIMPMLINFNFANLSRVLDSFVNLFPFWMLVGLSLEGLCFILALAYRGRLIELEKQQIQVNYTRDLEAQLEERTQQIQQQNLQLKHQYLKHLNTEFERKLAHTEMVALRAQMNPHFIFNCLNSIKLYTLQNDSEQASAYLTKFARLIRLVLENSRAELVTLRNELEALQLYIELEAMRFKNKVSFNIEVFPDIDTQYFKIPPLLLQPFVENAIWHGLMHKPQGGKVSISITQPSENLLHIEIIDNGIGRAKAAELKSKSAGKRKSFGMQVTADRIRMINQLYDTHTEARILT
jgi:sensor histidine kinase YesM